MAQEEDLNKYIDAKSAECLNANPAHPVQSVFQDEDGAFLESDCDEQLLFSIPFQQPVKIQSFLIKAPTGCGPKSIKIFINRRNLDFSEAESLPSVQSFDLKTSDFDRKIPLQFVKFQNVFSLTIFVKSNLGPADTTRIDFLSFFGSAIHETNMKNLCKTG